MVVSELALVTSSYNDGSKLVLCGLNIPCGADVGMNFDGDRLVGISHSRISR